jgi:hypothetical protein
MLKRQRGGSMNQPLNLPRRLLWTALAALLLLTFTIHRQHWTAASPGLRQSRYRPVLEDINNATLGVSGQTPPIKTLEMPIADVAHAQSLKRSSSLVFQPVPIAEMGSFSEQHCQTWTLSLSMASWAQM